MRWLTEYLSNPSSSGASTEMLLLSMLLAFIIGQLNAWVYMWTHRGVTYSRTFAQALVLICMIVTLSMWLITINVLAAFGILGGMAIIRFRNVVRDSRDTAYVLLALVCGLTLGLGEYLAAVVGATAANGIAVYMHLTGFGQRISREGLLRYQISMQRREAPELGAVLRAHCRWQKLLSAEEVSPGFEDRPERALYQYAYRVRLRDPEQAERLIDDLKAVDGVGIVDVVVRQEHEEVA